MEEKGDSKYVTNTYGALYTKLAGRARLYFFLGSLTKSRRLNKQQKILSTALIWGHSVSNTTTK